MSAEIDPDQWAEDAAQRLESVLQPDYYRSEIPTETDGQVAETVRAVLADPVRRVPALVALLTNDRRAATLCVFGLRAAAQARRTGDPRYLDPAVLAIGLSFNGEEDSRYGVAALSVPWHAAQSLGLDPGPIYRRVAAMPIGEGTGQVEEFAGRRPEDQTLEVMRLRETSDAGGVRYEQWT
jgi:hypothetical protein